MAPSGLDDTLGPADSALDETLAPADQALGETLDSSSAVGAFRSTMAASGDARDVGDVAARGHATTDLPVVQPSNYKILEEYARGGLGRIVRARDTRTGRIVAIKEMLGSAEEAARRFAREARVTANLQHPAIVPVYELGRWPSGEPFYAMKRMRPTSVRMSMRSARCCIS